MALKEDEIIKHLQWIYWRMIDIHNEKEGVDYMIKFNAIIDSIKQEASGSVAAPKEETNIDDNPATYTHFDMLAMVARQTKHMFEENTALREVLKELLGIMPPFALNPKSKAIIERARKLLSK